MRPDFFAQLETELGRLAHEGAHLRDRAARGRRRTVITVRRSIAMLTVATALAASLISEFPATARGLDAPTASAPARGLGAPTATMARGLGTSGAAAQHA